MVSPVDAAAEHPTCELLKGEGREMSRARGK